MVKNIERLVIAEYPQITKLNKWVLEVSKPSDYEQNKGIYLHVNIYFVSSISAADVGERNNYIYAIRFEKIVSNKDISTIDDLCEQCCINEIEDKISHTLLDSNKVCLYVSDDYEDLFRFVENIIYLRDVLP